MFGKTTGYSYRTNVFKEFHHFVKRKKKKRIDAAED